MSGGVPAPGRPAHTCLLRLHSFAQDAMWLGPRPATVLFLQGCHVLCPGCMSVETWDDQAGVLVDVADLARWLTGRPSRFLTVSGGEPTEQAPVLNRLLELLGDDWVVTVYSGHDLDALRADPAPGVSELLERVDVLIAGPYIPQRHADLLWRGSSNQVIHDFTGRAPIPPADVSAGVSVRITGSRVVVVGVPPEPSFLSRMRTEAAKRDVGLVISDDPRTFPFPTQEPRNVQL